MSIRPGQVARGATGRQPSSFQLKSEGPSPSLPCPQTFRIAWRAGIDINPIDVTDADAMRWLRALIFPEHLERHQETKPPPRVARDNPVPIVTGDALTHLPALLSQAPQDSHLCLYASMVLYQFSPEARKNLWRMLAAFSATRPVSTVILDGVPEGWAQLLIRDFKNGGSTKRHLAAAHATVVGWSGGRMGSERVFGLFHSMEALRCPREGYLGPVS